MTLRLWLDPAGPSAERVCCSPDAVIAARRTCHELGLPHVTLDLREAFRDAVVQPFVDAYAAGLTPNPCMRCNGSFRFDELVVFAGRAGADVLWTGHYARIEERGGRRLIARGLDPAKDQSYMLATVDPALLAPRGLPARLRDEGARPRRGRRRRPRSCASAPRARRRASSPATTTAPSSSARVVQRADGPIVDEEGREVGRHDGTWRYTTGQRRGIGVAAREPLYALRTDRATNTLVVGRRGSLDVRRVEAQGSLYAPVERAEVKLRYRSPPVSAAVEPTAGGFVLQLDRPAYAVAPGQVAVLYDGDAVVGAGAIVSAG